ncbi:hypothetical protein SIN8267_03570 [Sinobacterium norvegicum]|uniref:Retropepsin-like aspartic endopeptidase domain-containing protein n=1 Tax=Sinobacterium norvegicum TaxID=1641715 RepID=A0ABN8ELZ6_9GAMM|nr:ATP-dependent zinc protease [Sinobacterium norvegicum]CAH0993421.1 hypothetical protein SIN8267_03570 [Sinobacterium norvegicum]
MSYRLKLTALALAIVLTGCETFQLSSKEQEPAPIPPVVEPKEQPPVVVEPDKKDVTTPKTDPVPPQKVEPEEPKVIIPATKLTIIGATELVTIKPGNFTLEARIDTGAKGTSMNAINIQEFERDGKKWVKFTVPTGKDTSVELERPVEKTVLIKRHGEDSLRRKVVMLQLKIGKIEQRIEVNITDRSNYEFPMLIGRNFLKDIAVVDVSQDRSQGKPK